MGCFRGQNVLDYGELNFSFYRVNTVDQNAYAVSQVIGLARALPDNLSSVFAKRELISCKRRKRHETFDEKVGEFDEEPKFCHADDEPIEFFADTILHELYFLPLH